jgi:hypothetical protein
MLLWLVLVGKNESKELGQWNAFVVSFSDAYN